MSWYAKVAWQEGLFFRPQLFQQQERYFERYAHLRATSITPFFFGFTQYAIDHEALTLGKVIIKSASGLFPDGTPFEAPSNTILPLPLTVQPEHANQEIHLALPVRLPNCEETTFDNNAESLARYRVFETELRDTNSIGLAPEQIQLSSLRLKLIPEKELSDAWISLPLTKIKDLRADGGVELVDTHVPPVAGYGASGVLKDLVAQVCDLTRMRAEALAKRLAGDTDYSAGVATVTDYLLLQILNRYEPLLNHAQLVPTTVPADIYALLISMSGELSTHLRTRTRRPLESPLKYEHMVPYASLKHIADDTCKLLNAVLVRSAQNIPLEDQGHGLRSANIDLSVIKGFSSLVLAVNAAMPADMLQKQFAVQAKVAPSSRVQDLVHSHLPGIEMQSMPVAPRQIPFNAGYVYYQLAPVGPLWEEVLRSGGISLHIAGELPDLKIELWGVRG